VRRPRPGAWRGGLGLALATAVLVGPALACSDDEPEEGEGRLELADDGSAVVVRQDGDREEVDDDTEVRTGDAVTLREGTGRIELGGGTVLELRAGVGDDEDTELVMGPQPLLEEGDLLVETTQRFVLAAGETTLELRDGAARVSRAIVLEVASYDADVHLDSAGQERDIPGLREMQVPAEGLPPDEPRPFEYEPDNPWDRRFLSDAIELGDRLESLGDGYTANLDADDGRTVAFFRAILPGLLDEVDLTPELLGRGRPPGETLIGAAIADLGRRGTFAERWQAVFSFRDAGASWGLVALDQGVDRGSLLDAVTEAVESTELAIAPPTTTGGGGGGGTGTSAGGAGGAGPAATTPTTRPRTPTTPTTRPPPPPVEETSDGLLPPLLGPIVDPVTDLLSGLVDGLLGGLFSAAPRG
jgi:hypothetical protein